MTPDHAKLSVTPQVATRVAYLVNQYPKVSHTFIRREILALEAMGFTIARISVRPSPDQLKDPLDVVEQSKTIYILASYSVAVIGALILSVLQAIFRLPKVFLIWCTLFRQSGFSLKNVVYLVEACWLYQYCKKHRIQHLHAHFGTNPATLALLCHQLGGPSYSFTVHGPEEFDAPQSLSLPLKIQYAKHVIAISSFGRSQLYRWSAFNDWSKIAEIHCALDESLFNRTPASSPEPFRLVSVGRLCEQKGQMILVQAISQLQPKYPNIQLHLIGDGELREPLEAFLQSHQLQSNVHIHGWQGTDYILQQLDSAIALVLPSFAEGLPVVIMESLARKRPVISTYIAGIPELVCHQNGWLIPAGDLNALVAAIEEALLASKDEILAKGLHGHHAVRERHSASIEAAKLAKLWG